MYNINIVCQTENTKTQVQIKREKNAEYSRRYRLRLKLSMMAHDGNGRLHDGNGRVIQNREKMRRYRANMTQEKRSVYTQKNKIKCATYRLGLKEIHDGHDGNGRLHDGNGRLKGASPLCEVSLPSTLPSLPIIPHPPKNNDFVVISATNNKIFKSNDNRIEEADSDVKPIDSIGKYGMPEVVKIVENYYSKQKETVKNRKITPGLKSYLMQQAKLIPYNLEIWKEEADLYFQNRDADIKRREAIKAIAYADEQKEELSVIIEERPHKEKDIFRREAFQQMRDQIYSNGGR